MAKSKKRGKNKQSTAVEAFNVREHTQAGKLAWILILALVAIIPIVMGNGPLAWMGINFVDGFDGVKVLVLRVGVIAILATWIWDVVMNGGEIRYHRVYILIGIFLAWVVITTVLSISPATAFLGKYRRYDGAWSYFLYALLFFLTIQYATSYVRVRQLAQALSFSSVIVAGYGLLQAIPNPFGNAGEGAVANLDPLTWGALPFEPLRSFSTYGNPNLLAGFLAFSIFITIGLLFSEDQAVWRRWYWFVLLLNSAVAVTAFSRSLWVAAAVSLVLLAILMWRQRVRPEKDDYVFAGGLAAVVSAFIAYSLTRADAVMNFWTRIQTILEFDQGSGLTRFQIWEAAIVAIAERPIFGFGLDTFRLIFRHFAPPDYAQAAGFRSVADNAHNFPLQMATGIGIVGLILFYAILFWLAYLAIRKCLQVSEGQQREKMLFVGILCACVAYCVHLFFGLSLPAVSFLLWIFMGVFLLHSVKTIEVKRATWMLPAAIFASTLLLVPAVFAVRLAAADNAYIRPASLVAGGISNANIETLRMVKADAERTVRLNPFYERYYLDYFVILSAYALQNAGANNPAAPELIEEAKQKVQHLIDMSPWEFDSYLAYVNFYLNLSRLTGGEEGRAYLEYLADFTRDKLERTPTGLALRMRYAEVLVELGDIDAAREQIEFVVAHDSNYTAAAEFLDQLNQHSQQLLEAE